MGTMSRRRKQESDEAVLADFRVSLATLLSLAAFAYCWVFLILEDITLLRPAETLIVVSGLALALVTFALSTVRPGTGNYPLLLGGMLIGLKLAVTFQGSLYPCVLVIVTLAAGLMLGSMHAFLSGTLSSVIILCCNEGPIRLASTYPWIGVIWTTVGLVVATDRRLRLMHHWERETVSTQRLLIRQLRDRQGELNRTLKALDEAYERLKRMNQELMGARHAADEARTAKEQFVASVSHELRTPLGLIMGFSELMFLSPQSYTGVVWTPELTSDVGRMYRASHHLMDLVNDVLDLTRIDAARLPMFRELANIRPILEEAVMTVAPLLEQRGLEHSLDCPANLPQLYVDRTRLRQIMLNLLNNAAKFTETGSIRVHANADDNQVVVSVQDTGYGIPEGQVGYLFEAFSQTEIGTRQGNGAGLGLALSRRFVQMHGGRMWVESQVGLGSTFHFSLPLPGSSLQTSLLSTHRHGGKAEVNSPVIVVDPDASVAGLLQRYLGDRHMLAVEGVDQAEALIEREHPQAIVINVPPDNDGGESWLGTIGRTSNRYSVPIIRCSIPSLSWLPQTIGADDYVPKPVTSMTLLAIVRRYCRQHSTVLIADDDIGQASLMGRILASRAAVGTIITAYSGTEAIRSAHESVPNLILLDPMMPDMDGSEVIQTVRADPRLSSVPVVVLTDTDYNEDRLRRRGDRFTITYTSGIPVDGVHELLAASLQALKPDYTADARTPPRV